MPQIRVGYKAEFNNYAYDVQRMSFVEDRVINTYHMVIANPLILMQWIYSIDEFYMLLFPHLVDASQDIDNLKENDTSMGGNKYGILEGRDFFETRIRELLTEGWKIQRENEKAYTQGKYHKIKIDGELIAKCRETIQKLKLLKKFLGFEVPINKKRNIETEWREQYGRPNK